MVLTVSFALSLVIGLSCHHRLRISPQTWRQRRGVRTTRLLRPHQPPFVKGAIRVHRIPPHVRDDRERPSW